MSETNNMCASNEGSIDISELPDGKQYHFLVVNADNDWECVNSIIHKMEERYGVKCVCESRDCKPGVDRFEFFRSKLITSLKVVLFLSRNLAEDSWCMAQQNMCLAASHDRTIPCIVPVVIADIHGITEFTPFTTVKVINATSETDDVPALIVDTISGSDLHATMVPFECVNVFARFENGYYVNVPVERIPTRCNRPSKYQFYIGRELIVDLHESGIKLDENFMHAVTQFVNKQPVMKTFDYLKKRNIACWGIVFFTIFALLTAVLVTSIYILVAFHEDRPFDGLLFPPWFVAFLVGPCLMLDVYVIIIGGLMFCVPKIYGREKKDTELQAKICTRFMRQCIDNNVMVVYSGRKNRQPNLQIMRYNFEKCRKFLIDFVRRYGQTLNIERPAEAYAEELVERHVAEMAIIACINYDSLPMASSNRHNMRGGKMCICQMAERQLQQALWQNVPQHLE